MDGVDKIAVRVPPTGAILSLHRPGEGGKCQWCGKPVLNADGSLRKRKYWHDECLHDFKIISHPGYTRGVVFERDHGVCFTCGADYSEMSMFKPAFRNNEGEARVTTPYLSDNDPKRWLPDFPLRVGPYTELRVISLWHVDHVVPLWKVVNLPPLERLEYFRLPNLVTLCEVCHKRKSAKEEAEKAHFDRQEAIQKGTAKEKVSRFGSRPFQKREPQWPKGRKMQSGPMRRKKKEEDDDEADRES